MSRFDEEMEKYRAQMNEVAPEGYEDGWLVREAQRLGPNIYNADAALVSCSDAEELARVKATFQKRFGGGLDEQELEAAVNRVCQERMGSQRRKYRAVFYYLLTIELNKGFED